MTRAAAAWPLLRSVFTRRRLRVMVAMIAGRALGAVQVIPIIAANPAQPLRHHISQLSLMHGWVPPTAQAITGAVLVCAIGWRSRRWRVLWLPAALVVGVLLALWAHSYIGSAGVAGDPAPRALWIWIGLTGLAVGVLVVGWRGARWWRRGAALLAVPLCLLCAGLALNGWVGYFPIVYTVWNQLTAGQLPNETDRASVTAMQLKGEMPDKGVVVPVSIMSVASKFKHRGELVYLPPAWFATNPPPRLPVVMMIGGEFNTPAEWLRAGNAIGTIDSFAATHGGNAPVLVFVDSGGAFNIDTECVNGPRGNAADHLTKDVVPFLISNFGVSTDRSRWGVAGFSAGGTCAVDLAVMHPELFSAFVDIAGDLGPNTGTKAQTIARLFGGNPDAWTAFDPTAVITRHGPYRGVSGWFAIVGDHEVAADALCTLGTAKGIPCAVVPQPGKHDWAFAGRAFAAALPWVAGQLGTPRVPRVPFPRLSAAVIPEGQAGPASSAQAAGK